LGQCRETLRNREALVLKTCATAVVAVLSLLAPVSASPQRLPARTADPLVGTWDTAPIPLASIRAGLTAHGYAADSIDKLFHTLLIHNQISKSIKYEIRFYRDNGVPFQIVIYWDPATHPRPSYAGADHGPYKLLPGRRAAFRGTDPPTNTWITTYSYRATGKTLRLKFASLVEPGLSENQRRADQKQKIALAIAPYKKVGP
jgi:hypothetical protein